MEMVTSQERVGPTRRFQQRVVLENGCPFQHLLLFAVVLHPLVGTGPDAFAVARLTKAFVPAAAGAISHVLGTLRHRTKIRDVRQRTIAAVTTIKYRRLARTLHGLQIPRTVFLVFGARVKPSPQTEELRIRRERSRMHHAAETVPHRHVLRLHTPAKRRLVVGIDTIRIGQPRLAVFGKEIELLGPAVADPARELFPVVGAVRLSLLPNLAGLLDLLDVTQVRGAVPQALEDRHLLGRQFDEERVSAVSLLASPFTLLLQFVRDHNTGNLALIEHRGNPRVEKIHVAHQRNVLVPTPPMPRDQFVKLAAVIPDLADDEVRTRSDLAIKLEQLRHHLALVQLEVAHGCAKEETGAGKTQRTRTGLRGRRNHQPLVHGVQQRQQRDGIQVRRGTRPPLEPT